MWPMGYYMPTLWLSLIIGGCDRAFTSSKSHSLYYRSHCKMLQYILDKVLVLAMEVSSETGAERSCQQERTGPSVQRTHSELGGRRK